MPKIILVILIVIFFPLSSYSAELSISEKGKLLGSLGFGALTIDAYYEICYSNGIRTDNNLNGLNKLTKKKWGVTFSEMSKDQEKRSGRNIRQEAHNLVNTVIQKTGGCNTTGMKNWFIQFQNYYENNLDKFHASQ